jgi:hypothetical protein
MFLEQKSFVIDKVSYDIKASFATEVLLLQGASL